MFEGVARRLSLLAYAEQRRDAVRRELARILSARLGREVAPTAAELDQVLEAVAPAAVRSAIAHAPDDQLAVLARLLGIS